MALSNTDLKPIIDDILGWYFNTKTRLMYDTKTQKDMVAQNRGLMNACTSIVNFSENEDELVEYIKQKRKEINEGEAQEVSFK